MISVTFTADVENIVATEHLYQWDNGQKLSISGVGTTADIHFANKKSEKALVVTPNVTSGACVAPIPNSLLAEPYPILAYVYVPSDDGARTLKTVTIAVEARKQPLDFVLDEDEGITTVEAISQRVNAIMSSIQTDYGNFKTTIQSELDDMIANATIPNADTANMSYRQYLRIFSDGKDILAYAISDECNYGEIVRVKDSPSCPIDFGYSASDNDFFYQIFKLDNSWITVKAFDIRSNAEFVNSYCGGVWIGWARCNDGGNAATANTAGTLATTPSNICLRNISAGTEDLSAGVSELETGAIYIVYE